MKRFLFLVLTVTLMIFVSYNAFAEDAFPEGKVPDDPSTNPFQQHVRANGRSSIQTAINMPGSATQENRVANDDCPLCKSGGMFDGSDAASSGKRYNNGTAENVGK